jgi:hypothetical protein
MFAAEFPRGIVAVFLESVDLIGEPAKRGDGAGELFGVSGELLSGFGFEKEFGKAGGSELEADFGQVAGVMLTEIVGEVILEEADLNGVLLFEAPFLKAAAGFPIGDIARRDFDPDVLEGVGDFLIGEVVVEHSVNHVALEFGEPGDFAVAGDFPGGALDAGGRVLD